MRGEVYGLRAPRDARGHEQQGRRFAVIVQARRFAHLSTWLAIPTSTSAKPAIYRPGIVIPGHGETLALCEGVNAIDPQVRLAEHVGTLSLYEMQMIDRALRIVLDLEP